MKLMNGNESRKKSEDDPTKNLEEYNKEINRNHEYTCNMLYFDNEGNRAIHQFYSLI